MNPQSIPGGHILIARQISNSAIWIKTPLYLKCFLWILISANHAERRKRSYLYKRGELVTTYDEIIKAMTHYHNRKPILPSPKEIRLILEWLTSEGMIEVQAICARGNDADELPNKGAHSVRTGAYLGIKIVVVNYDTYQTSENYKGAHKGAHPSQLGSNNNNEKKEDIYTSDFLSFWSAYPRKVGKRAAFKAWNKINLPTLIVILESIERHKQMDQWKDEKFIPHPATWLNQGRWEDEIDEQKEAGNGWL